MDVLEGSDGRGKDQIRGYKQVSTRNQQILLQMDLCLFKQHCAAKKKDNNTPRASSLLCASSAISQQAYL